MNTTKIGFMGCKINLPLEFPLEFPENSGNIIHANAPHEMFPGAVHLDDFYIYGDSSLSHSSKEWINNESTHLIVTLANEIRLDVDSVPYLQRLQETLEGLDTEIVIFGLGAQSVKDEIDKSQVAPEVVGFMRYLGERCKAIGVRGEFTKKVFKTVADVDNIFVTGCPSVFSNPGHVSKLWNSYKYGKNGRISYNGSYFHKENEQNLLVRAIQENSFLVEQVNKYNHYFYVKLMHGQSEALDNVPYFLQRAIKSGELSIDQASNFYQKYYRLFRNPLEWYQFNEEMVSFSFGSRFHGNMAAHLSGVPSLWLTHDSRTREMSDFLHLPCLSLEEAVDMSTSDILAAYNPEEFFENIHSKFKNFNDYLEIFGLPLIEFSF